MIQEIHQIGSPKTALRAEGKAGSFGGRSSMIPTTHSLPRKINPHTALRRACLTAAQWVLGDDFVPYNQLGGLGTRAGTPDTLACYRGQFLAIEYKTGKGRLSPAQKDELERVSAAGGLTFLVRSVDDWLFILKRLKEGYFDGRKTTEGSGKSRQR